MGADSYNLAAAAAPERAHDRGAAADVRLGLDHDAGRNPPLYHRRPERAGVEVDEPGIHDRSSDGEVGAEANVVGVGDANARGHYVVGHARELVHRAHLELDSLRDQLDASALEFLAVEGATVAPDDVRQDAEDPLEVAAMGLDLALREEVEPEIDIRDIDRRVGEIADESDDRAARALISEWRIVRTNGSERHSQRLEDGVIVPVPIEDFELAERFFERAGFQLEATSAGLAPDDLGEDRGRTEVLAEVRERVIAVEHAPEVANRCQTYCERDRPFVFRIGLDLGDEGVEFISRHGRNGVTTGARAARLHACTPPA